ncbi:MAG: DUF4037 domain-containing protein [Lachnospiraceae bacterium]|nr:DUF4037 domain-containing protein [Lachnospiraceae bacterium]
MKKDTVSYFDAEITSMIKKEYKELYPKLSILILGSAGLGIDDKFSDLEAAFYLNDSDWKESGANLQLSLNEILRKHNPWQQKGSVLCVHPISWLLDGQAESILSGKDDIHWDQIEISSLYTIQNNRIYYDPEGKLSTLRERTKAECYPNEQWKKKILISFRTLISEDYPEFYKCVIRSLRGEAQVLAGRMIEELLEMAFLLQQQYYPWRTHLTWAFSQSPSLLETFGSDIEEVIMGKSMRKKLLAVQNAIETYKEYMITHDLLPEVDMKSEKLDEELLWAERMHAWENPDWHAYVNSYSKEAVEDGYPADDFWVWSLWGKSVKVAGRKNECKDT